MRVLVVEDEPDVSAVFRDFLIELGHEAVPVRSAEAALVTLERERPDAIILDIHLPGLSGLASPRLAPVRDSGLPIIAVSGVATESQARECLRLGAFDFLGKPVAFDRLGEVLATLEPHALHRQLSLVGRSPERRRAARIEVVFPIRILQFHGAEWQGWAHDLSPFGVSVKGDATVQPGEAGEASVPPPRRRAPGPGQPPGVPKRPGAPSLLLCEPA